jgi:hypothetical protein
VKELGTQTNNVKDPEIRSSILVTPTCYVLAYRPWLHGFILSLHEFVLSLHEFVLSLHSYILHYYILNCTFNFIKMMRINADPHLDTQHCFQRVAGFSRLTVNSCLENVKQFTRVSRVL